MTDEELKQLQCFLMTLPPIFDVEITNHCNVSCVMCPRWRMKRPLGRMTERTFDRLLELLDESGEDATVSFSGIGEPLLHPQLFDSIERLERGRVNVSVTTNGMLLGPDVVRQIADLGLDSVCVSINGATPEVYEGIMRGAKFERVVSQTEHLIASVTDRTKVVITATVTKLNAHEMDALESFWVARGVDAVEIRPCHSRGGHLQDPEVFDFSPPTQGNACGILARIHFIAWNGDVLSCCHDLAGQAVLGNIHTADLDTLRRVKSEIVLQEQWFPMCAQCDDSLRFELLGIPNLSAPLVRLGSPRESVEAAQVTGEVKSA